MTSKSLRFKFIAVTCVICLLCLLFVSLASYYISYTIVRDEAQQKSLESVQKYASEINNWFVEQSTLVNCIADDIEINGDYSDPYLQDYLSSKLKGQHSLVIDYYIGFTDKNRKFIDGSGWNPPADFNYHTRSWYIEALHAGRLIYTTPYVDAITGKMIVTIAAPVKADDKIIGVIGADILVDDLVRVCQEARKSWVDYVFLLDQQHNFLVHKDIKLQPTPNGLKNAALVQGSKYKPYLNKLEKQGYIIAEIKDYDGINKYFILSKVKASQWTLGIAIPTTEYLAPLNKLLIGFTAALAVSLTFGIIIILFMINGLLKPIRLLRKAVYRYAQKDFNARSPVLANDEVGELSHSFNQMADIIQDYSQKLEDKVRERTHELQEINESIMQSIDYAKRIQLSILPDMNKYKGSTYSDYFVIWKPRDVVGGDFYFFKKVNNLYYLAVADCTGHSVPGALMTMSVNAILDRVTDQAKQKNPGMILHEVNRILKETLGQRNPRALTNDGVDIGLCLIKPDENELIYAGAKIPLIYCSNNGLVEIKGDRQSLGYKKSKLDYVYQNHSIKLDPDTVFYLFTDGFVDQNGSSNLLGFGRTRLKHLISEHHNRSLSVQKDVFEKLLDDYMGDEEQRDDITLIGFKVTTESLK